MERLTEWNREYTHGQLIKGDGITRLCEYEDTGLTPEEIQSLQKEYISFSQDYELLSKDFSMICDKYDNLQADRDYWKAEALKHCAKLGEIKLLVGRTNEWQRLN